MEVPELRIKVIVTGIIAETIARTTYNSCKSVNHYGIHNLYTSVTLKRINKTPHSFMHLHSVIWTREFSWKYPSCVSKLLSQELLPKQLRERLIIAANL